MARKFHFLVPAFESQTHLTVTQLGKDIENHLKALRPLKGDCIKISDGCGRVDHFEFLDKAKLKFLNTSHAEKLLPKTHVYLSMPIGNALTDCVESLVQLGAWKIIFVRSEFSQQKKDLAANLKSRLNRVALEACHSAERSFLPVLDFSQIANFSSALEKSAEIGFLKLVAREDLNNTGVWGLHKNDLFAANHEEIQIWIGPEGGWSTKERQRFDELKFVSFGLGPNILRVPIACSASLVLIQHLWSQRQKR